MQTDLSLSFLPSDGARAVAGVLAHSFLPWAVGQQAWQRVKH